MLWLRTDRSSRRRRTFRGSPRRSRPSSSTRNEGHANREGCWLLRGLPPQPLEPRDERAIVHRHLPVEDERPGLEPADRFDELGESRGEVAAIPADQAHGTRGLERYHPPAVYLLLVDPPGAMEGRATSVGCMRGKSDGAIARGVTGWCALAHQALLQIEQLDPGASQHDVRNLVRDLYSQHPPGRLDLVQGDATGPENGSQSVETPNGAEIQGDLGSPG